MATRRRFDRKDSWKLRFLSQRGKSPKLLTYEAHATDSLLNGKFVFQ